MVCIRERPHISYGRSLALHFRYLTCLLDRGHITVSPKASAVCTIPLFPTAESDISPPLWKIHLHCGYRQNPCQRFSSPPEDPSPPLQIPPGHTHPDSAVSAPQRPYPKWRIFPGTAAGFWHLDGSISHHRDDRRLTR